MKPLEPIDLNALPVHELDDSNIALPTLRTAGLQGWIGELARHAADGTEVHPAAAALNALGYAAACLCAGVYLMIGDDRHRPILNLVHVGRTALGGKGMSAGLVYRVHEALSCGTPHLPRLVAVATCRAARAWHSRCAIRRAMIQVWRTNGYGQPVAKWPRCCRPSSATATR